MEIITRLIREVINVSLQKLIIIILLFAVPFYFSKKAQSTFFHLLYSISGIYILFHLRGEISFYNVQLLVALGLLIPQVRFMKQFVIDSIFTAKMMTANTYYFFITIYYKIVRILNWFQSTYKTLNIFFTTFSFKKQEYRYKEKEYKEQKSYYKKQEKFYEEKEQKSESKQSYKEESKKDYGEYERFYSDNAYIVLGVSIDDDFNPTIKKAYRKLVRIHHPDLNPDNIKQATEITQLINKAYEKLEKIHN